MIALTVTAGTWYPTATSYSYQWQRNTGSGFADIAGASNPTYFTVPTDVSATIRARVTATNTYGSVTATRDPRRWLATFVACR